MARTRKLASRKELVTSLNLGIYVNNRAAVFLGQDYSMARMLEAARLAETLGFDFVSVGDSILAKPRYSPIPVLAAIAAQTKRIQLSTGILQPHMRQPVILAQEWTTLDVISDGRSILCVGLGTGPRDLVEREYEMVGISKKLRGKAFDEVIEILKCLWTQDTVNYEGTVYKLRDVSIGFRPVQSPHPPIVIACGGYVPTKPGVGPNDFYSEKTAGTFHGPFARVARIGDGWITGIITPAEFAETFDLIRSIAREQYGRTLGPEFRTVLNCFINVGDNAQASRSEAVDILKSYHRLPFDDETIERWTIYGPPEQCAERITQYANAGVNSFQFVIAARDQLGQVRAIAERVKPLLHA